MNAKPLRRCAGGGRKLSALWWLLLHVALCVASTAAVAADRTDADDREARYLRRAAEEERYYALERRARQIRPGPRNGPLRWPNVSDEEVREMRVAAAPFLPRSIVSIAGVTTGCSCEDGPKCTDQVWILATEGPRTDGLQLCRIDGRWEVGPVQRWWLRYDDLLRRARYFPSYWAFELARRRMLDEMPRCEGGAGPQPTETRPPP